MPRGKKGTGPYSKVADPGPAAVAAAPPAPDPAPQPESTPLTLDPREQLQAVITEINALDASRQELVQKVNGYVDQVTQTIRGILTDVGVWDEVHALELERQDVTKKAQDKLNAFQRQLEEKIRRRDILVQAVAAATPRPAAARQWTHPTPPEI